MQARPDTWTRFCSGLYVYEIPPAASVVYDCTVRPAINSANYRLSALSAMFSSRHYSFLRVLTHCWLHIVVYTFLVGTLLSVDIILWRLFGNHYWDHFVVGSWNIQTQNVYLCWLLRFVKDCLNSFHVLIWYVLAKVCVLFSFNFPFYLVYLVKFASPRN